MKSNILVKSFAVVIVLVLAALIVFGKKDRQAQSAQNATLYEVESGPAQEDNGLDVTPLTYDYIEDEYAVDADTPVQTMRTLTQETRAAREESVKLRTENSDLRSQINRLLSMEEKISERVEKQMTQEQKDALKAQQELEKKTERTYGMIGRLERRIEKMVKEEMENNKTRKAAKKGGTTANGYDIGAAGIPAGLGYGNDAEAPAIAAIEGDPNEVVWVNPLDVTIDPKGKMRLPKFTKTSISGNTTSSSRNQGESGGDEAAETGPLPVYTIPANATLLRSVSMTAMLGRIPVDGKVTDAYPFKIILGQENLSSNGIRIPGLTGIKMSGVARGDWTLSCVSGDINSMTFTFEDGTIVTEEGALAWFSDTNGIPCITGKRITNAPTYLAQRIALSAANAYSAARAESQFTTSVSGDTATRTLTGDIGELAKSNAITGGLEETTDWLDKRQSESFDAIYVPPGTQLAVHINTEIKIDYDPNGRKVNHYANIQDRTRYYLD